jgi:transposase-like protein
MKTIEKAHAIRLRQAGYSISEISRRVGVAKSSISLWVRDIQLTQGQQDALSSSPFSSRAIEKRRQSRIANEKKKRNMVIASAAEEVKPLTHKELWLVGIMLYWAEGGKTQRMVRFSNGDPEMIKIMMRFFRIVCKVPEEKFRGYIHIHPHLDANAAENYWSVIADIPIAQFFKTYTKQNKSSQNKRDTLPFGVMDIYVMDTKLFLQIQGWAKGIFRGNIDR